MLKAETDETLAQALAWKKQGLSVAIATVIKTWGSSPRPAGSQMAISERGTMAGSVSGGCVEGAVIQEALEIMGGAKPKILEFSVSNERAWEVGLACGGALQIYVEPIE